jgi:4-hydroxy-2-oxoheptanedioate aldolase
MLNRPQSRRKRSTSTAGDAEPTASGPNALARLRAGVPVFGAIQAMPGAPGTHVAVRSGAEFVILDCEHGSVDLTAHKASLQILADEDAFSAVRVRPDDLVAVETYAALGADVILMPNIISAATARAFVAAGGRGRGAEKAGDVQTTTAPLLMAMVESKAAVAEIRDIAAVPGLGALVVGPNDLCGDLGHGADFASPVFQDALLAVERAAKDAAIVLGSGVYPGISVSRLLQGGHTFILAANDLGALQAGYRDAFDLARAMVKDIKGAR